MSLVLWALFAGVVQGFSWFVALRLSQVKYDRQSI